MKGQVALVTGASRGIGRAVALALAAQGAHLVLTARSQGGLEETDDLIRQAGGTATLLPLDLVKEAEKIDMLGPSIVERFGRLDILVHSAAVLAKLTPVAHIMPRDWNENLAVNLSAAWRLIRSCDPPLRTAPAGRAVFLTDAKPAAYWGLYGAAKAGEAHLVQTWAAEVTQTPLRVTLADPGPVATNLRASAFPGEDQAKLRQPGDAARAVVALLASEMPHGAIVQI